MNLIFLNKKFKSFVSFIIILILICNSTCYATSSSLLGDLNGDGRFNSIDISMLRINLKAGTTYIESADMNVDDVIDLKDLVRMKKIFK